MLSSQIVLRKYKNFRYFKYFVIYHNYYFCIILYNYHNKKKASLPLLHYVYFITLVPKEKKIENTRIFHNLQNIIHDHLLKCALKKRFLILELQKNCVPIRSEVKTHPNPDSISPENRKTSIYTG